MDGQVDSLEKHRILGIVVLDILYFSKAAADQMKKLTLGVSCDMSMIACKIPFSISMVLGFSVDQPVAREI